MEYKAAPSPKTKRKQKDKEENPDAIKKLKAMEEKGACLLRLLITKEQVGAIIGREGAHVKRLRDDANVFVSVLWSKNQFERVVEIKGTPEDISNAVKLIAEYFGPQDGGTHHLSILIPDSQIGCLIGKGGSHVRQAMQDTGARIEIAREKKGESTEKIVGFFGSPDALKLAAGWLGGQILSNPKPGSHYVPYKPPQPRPGQESTDAARPGTPPSLFGGFQQPPYSVLPPPSFAPPPPYYHADHPPDFFRESHHAPHHAPPPSHHALPAPTHTHHQPHHPPPPPPTIGEIKILSSTTIAIPMYAIPGVIGRGGTVIRNIHRQSSAHIKIAEVVPGQNHRVATITGSEAAVLSAVQLIQNRIAELPTQ